MSPFSVLPNWFFPIHGGDEEIRTLDPLLAGQVLSQLSYTPRGFILRLPLRTLKIEQRLTELSRTRISSFVFFVR